MIVEHRDIPAARIAAVVRREWSMQLTAVEHLEVDSGGWHWTVGDDSGPQWFATMDAVRTSDDRRTRIAALETATELARDLPFVVAPVPTHDARVAVDVAPGLLLTLAPYLEGAAMGCGPFDDDRDRSQAAIMLGELHVHAKPRRLPRWQAQIGRQSGDRRDDLLRCLEQPEWSGGPWSAPAGRLVLDAGPVLQRALRRFALLAAAVSGSLDRWVVTHGDPRATKLVRTPDGVRLVGWGAAALAPRERDLIEVLGEAEGNDPWYAYVEGGGRPEPLSPDVVELFSLQRHLSVIAEHAALFSRPHEDTADGRRCFGELEGQVGELTAEWP